MFPQAAELEIEKLRKQLHTREAATVYLRDKLQNAQEDAKSANAKVTAMQTTIDIRGAEYAALKATHEEHKEKLSKVENDFEQFSNLTREELAKEREVSSELQTAREEITNDLATCKAELIACKIDKQETEERITSLESELKSTSCAHEQNISSISNEKEKVSKELSDLRERIEEGEFPLNDNAECTVCMEKVKSIALKPCGHLVVCEDCLFSLGKEKDRHCPICRSAVRGHLRVFFS